MTRVAYCFYCRSEVIVEPLQKRSWCTKCRTMTPCTDERVKLDWPDIMRDLKNERLKDLNTAKKVRALEAVNE